MEIETLLLESQENFKNADKIASALFSAKKQMAQSFRISLQNALAEKEIKPVRHNDWYEKSDKRAGWETCYKLSSSGDGDKMRHQVIRVTYENQKIQIYKQILNKDWRYDKNFSKPEATKTISLYDLVNEQEFGKQIEDCVDWICNEFAKVGAAIL